MIQNKSMTRAAKKRWASFYLDLSGTINKPTIIYDPENPILLHRADLIYTVATDANATTEGIQIGTTAGAATYMAVYAPLASQTVGTVVSMTLLKTFLPAATALIITRDAFVGSATQTGEVALVVWYEVLDRSPKK